MFKKLCARWESNRDPQAKHQYLTGAFLPLTKSAHGLSAVNWVYKPLLFTHITHWCASASYWIILH